MSSCRQYLAFSLSVALMFLPAVVNANARYSLDPNSCEIIVDTDLCGPGVRVGLCLQWAAIFIAMLLVPDDAISAFPSANVLTLSTIISFFSDALGNEPRQHLLVLELWIVVGETFNLYLGFIPAIFWIYEYKERFRPLWCTTNIIYSLILFTLAYLVAVNQASAQKKGCKRISVHESKRDRIYGAGFLTVCGLITLSTCLWNLRRFFRYYRRSRLGAHGHDQHHFLSRRYGYWEAHLNLVKSLVLLIAVVGGTYAISYNKADFARYEISLDIASFGSTSQLIPFLGGLLNLLYVFWRSFEKGVVTWPLTSWCSKMRMALDYLVHRSKITSQAICARISERRLGESTFFSSQRQGP